MATVNATLDAFINSTEFGQAAKDSTAAGFGGSGYSVELLPDGTWRVLWNNQIGNRYVSPGLILGIPQFDEETINDWTKYGDDCDLSFALDEAAEGLREALAYRLDIAAEYEGGA